MNATAITYKYVRRVAITVVGGTILLIGVALLVLPGPGLLTMAAGLTILGVEFACARRYADAIKLRTRQLAHRFKRRELPSEKRS